VKRPAFFLLATVIGFQLVIISGVLAGCFFVYPTIQDRDPGNERCSGESVSELLMAIVTQAFALYAAEK
tara:strand:+ start:371 stop:577 length:207 start_codon:yes stop_codon:yes gene_type:complete